MASQYDLLALKMVQIDMKIGSLANLKNSAITGLTGTAQACAVAAVDQKLESYAVRFQNQMTRLGTDINSICAMAGIAGVGELVIPPGQALETRFGLANAYLTLMDAKATDLMGLLNGETTHIEGHLNAMGTNAQGIFNEAVDMGFSADRFLDAWIAVIGA